MRTTSGLLRVGRISAAVLALAVVVRAQEPSTATVSYADVRPFWDALAAHLPAPLAHIPAGELDSAWRDWIRGHDAAIRTRIARGDEDSLVNLWLFGTSFTELPPARPRDVAAYDAGTTVARVADRRLDDLLEALTPTAADGRLRWAGEFLRARGIDPRTADGRARTRTLLINVRDRMRDENADYARVLEEPNAAADPVARMARYADLYRDRGLSSDTSILSSFSVDTTLEVLKTSGRIGGPIRRVAIVGPGLDFINKADGHDFYPEQTIQPFAVIDSLLRLGLSRREELSVTTFDVSARVNQHLADARARARTGTGYVVHLPLGDSERWSPALLKYWERAGERVGEGVRPAPPPRSAGPVNVRAVRVRPDVVMAVTPVDLNIVVERLEPMADDERFDLVVATNVFIYYDRFEQVLAVLNVGRMLRPGGSLLTNQAVSPVAPMKQAIGHDTIAYSDRQFDAFFWYQRQ